MNKKCHRLEFFAFATAAMLIAGCSDRPKEILPENDMVELMADLELAEAYIRSAGPELSDNDRKSIPEAVMAAHGVSKAQLDTTLAYYGRNADEYMELFDKVDKHIAERRRKIDGNVPDTGGNADNIWPYPSMIRFASVNATDGLVFSIPSDGISGGERLEWKLRTSSPLDAEGIFGVDYSDGTSSFIKRHFGGSRGVSLTLQTDTGRTPKRIYGVYRLTDSRTMAWADSIMLLHMPYDSATYYKVNQQYRYYGIKERKKNTEPTDQDSIGKGRSDDTSLRADKARHRL